MAGFTNWAIIGPGRIAAVFASALAGTPGARLSAVCSRDLERAKRFAAAAGPDAVAFSDIDAMLSMGRIDVVYVASPHVLHAAHAMAAIRAGKGVLIEKPFAASAAQARDIADAARAAGVFCMEAMWTRFLPAVREAERLARDGALGHLRAFQADLSFAAPYHPDSRLFSPALGGGALLDLGVYPLSLAIRLMGTPVAWRAAGVKAPTGVDMRAAVSIAFATGTASFSCGLDAEGANEALIIGDSARIRLHRPMNSPSALTVAASPPSLQADPDRPANMPPLPGPPATGTKASLRAALRPFNPRNSRVTLKPYRGNGLGHQIDEVQRCLRSGLTESPIMPLADSVLALTIIDDLRAQVASG